MNDKMIDLEEQISFELVYEKYVQAVCQYAQYTMNLSSQDAEDITSEAFLALFQSWDEIRHKTYPALFSWLRKAVRFLVYRKNQMEMRLPTLSFEELMDIGADADLFEDFAERSSYLEKMRLLQKKLNTEDYQLFEELVVERRDIVQIAQRRNVSVDSLYVRWHRLRKKIQKLL